MLCATNNLIIANKPVDLLIAFSTHYLVFCMLARICSRCLNAASGAFIHNFTGIMDHIGLTLLSLLLYLERVKKLQKIY